MSTDPGADGGAVDPAAPVPMAAGTFAIYPDGRGGFVLVVDSGTGPSRKHIPAAIVKAVTGSGLIGRSLKGLIG